jgi:YesN/AraC family two-component response regulator
MAEDSRARFLKQHLHEQVTLEQVCHDNLIGRTPLQKLMKEQFDMGVINYFHQLKIEEAKQQIRSGRLNFTQISAGLGYQSIQYFSRQFKKLTGMTPTEYSSIKALAESGFPEGLRSGASTK